MSKKILIEDIIFLENDDTIFMEGICEHCKKYSRGEEIGPIDVEYDPELDKYLARGGRHKTYFFFNILKQKTIMSVPFSFKLPESDRKNLANPVTIYDLKVVSLELEWETEED